MTLPAKPPRVARERGKDLPARRAVLAVALCELRALLRDKRAIFSAIILPILLYPVLLLGQGWLQRVGEETLAAREVSIGLELSSVPEEVAGRLRDLLEQELPIQLFDVDPSDLARIEVEVQEGSLEAAQRERSLVESVTGSSTQLLLSGGKSDEAPSRLLFRLHYDGANELANEALTRCARSLGTLRAELEAARIEELLGSDPAAGLIVEAIDVASEEDVGGFLLGRLLPLVAVLLLLSGGSYAALAAFAAEREAGTLETLLVQPLSTLAIAWGKYFAVLVASIVTLALNVASVLVCLLLGLGNLPGSAAGAEAPAIAFSRVAGGALLFLPVCILLCALLCLVCGRARSFREGQHYLLPLMLVAMVPTALATRGEVELDVVLACVPLAGPSLAFRDALSGGLNPLYGALSFLSACVWSALALLRLGRILEAERVFTARDTEQESAQRKLQSRRAIWIGLAGAFVIYLGGGWLSSWHVVWGGALALWLVLPALAVFSARGTARRSGASLLETLGLRLPHPAHVVGAVLLAPALARLTQTLLGWQEELLPLPAAAARAVGEGPLAELFDLHPALLLFLLAITPGICEELFFRGAILSGLKHDLRLGKLLLWQALLFGAAHASIYRFMPTALVGVVLTLICLRARSVVAAIFLHAAYNGFLVSQEFQGVLSLEDDRLLWLAIPGLLLLAWPRLRRARQSWPAS